MARQALPQMVLFDFGGVLLHLNDPVETFGFGNSHEEFSRAWLESPAVRAHETGRIGPEEFAERMVTDLGLPYSAQEFIRRFDSWPAGVSPATRDLLCRIPGDIECAILSNTNDLHWRKQDIYKDLAGRIARTFLSFETGHIKPDASAFTDVLHKTGYRAQEVLFIDDNVLNVAAAAALGLRTQLCPAVQGLAAVLESQGVLGSC